MTMWLYFISEIGRPIFVDCYSSFVVAMEPEERVSLLACEGERLLLSPS